MRLPHLSATATLLSLDRRLLPARRPLASRRVADTESMALEHTGSVRRVVGGFAS